MASPIPPTPSYPGPPVAPTPYAGGYPPGQDPMQPMTDPNYRPDPRAINPGNPSLVQPYDPRNDPRNRRARQNPMMNPPPPIGMRYGPASGAPTAQLAQSLQGAMGGGFNPNHMMNSLQNAMGSSGSGGNGNSQGWQGYGPYVNSFRGGGGGGIQNGGGGNGIPGTSSIQPQVGISDVLRPGSINLGFRSPTGLAPGRASYQF